MPIYEFKCSKDDAITEKFVTMDTEEIECPKCKGIAKKIMSACTFSLKGGGWFADGYSSKK